MEFLCKKFLLQTVAIAVVLVNSLYPIHRVKQQIRSPKSALLHKTRRCGSTPRDRHSSLLLSYQHQYSPVSAPLLVLLQRKSPVIEVNLLTPSWTSPLLLGDRLYDNPVRMPHRRLRLQALCDGEATNLFHRLGVYRSHLLWDIRQAAYAIELIRPIQHCPRMLNSHGYL